MPIKLKINVLDVSMLRDSCLNLSGRMHKLGKSEKELLARFSRHVVAIQPNDDALATRLWIFLGKKSINRYIHIIVKPFLQTPQRIRTAITSLDCDENVRVAFWVISHQIYLSLL